jgi:hypothetical protein
LERFTGSVISERSGSGIADVGQDDIEQSGEEKRSKHVG